MGYVTGRLYTRLAVAFARWNTMTRIPTCNCDGNARVLQVNTPVVSTID